jgi:hypothetical protein
MLIDQSSNSAVDLVDDTALFPCMSRSFREKSMGKGFSYVFPIDFATAIIEVVYKMCF